MFSDTGHLLALLVALSIGAWALSLANPQEPGARQWVCWGVIGCNSVYLVWRLSFTLPQEDTAGAWLAWTYAGIETVALLEAAIFWLCMSKTREASGPDRGHALAAPSAHAPSVEIWIPTYREPIEVLEKAVLAAQAVAHSRLRVKVLDDGDQEWLRLQCIEWQVDYLRRGEHKHAKAGNLNNALASTEADFIVVMDADFAAGRQFVKAALPYFDNPRLAILQTPQTFYNTDLAQQHLGLGGGMADEQALFFREIQPARDAWNVAFFCGSCAMIRTAALRDVGGFATESITEDLLTSLRMLARNWQVRYLNEALSMGLAAESIEAFFVQRDRWSRGAIQTLLLPDGPLRNPHLSLMQRLLFMPLYWLINPFFNLAIMLAPAICLLTGWRIMVIEQTADLYMFVLPTVLLNLAALTWISRGRFSPILSSALSMVMAVRLSVSAVVGLADLLGLDRASSKIFKVTPKGRQTTAASDRTVFWVFMSLTLVTLLAMIYASWVAQRSVSEPSIHAWLIFLSAYNLVHFLLAMVLVEDRPRKRSEERFQIDKTLPIQSESGLIRHVQVVDMSANGIKFVWSQSGPLPGQWHLVLGEQKIPMQVLRQYAQGNAFTCVGNLMPEGVPQRRAVIQYLFSGEFLPASGGSPRLWGALKRAARAVAGA